MRHHPFTVRSHRHRAALLLLASIALLLSSCQQKELCYDHNHTPGIHVTFDWSDNPDANPSSMMVYLYPRTTGETVIKREFAGKDGGVTQVKAGVSYTILAFDSDAKNTYFKELEDENAMEVTSMDATTVGPTAIPASEMPRVPGTEGQRWSMPADSIYAATSSDDVRVEKGEDDKGETVLVNLKPERRFYTFHISVLHVDNPGSVTSSVAAALTGLAGGINLSTGGKSNEVVTVPFGLTMTADSTLTGTFQSYGDSPVADTPNYLLFYAVLTDGSKWQCLYDVTQQVEAAGDDYDIYITIANLPVPKKSGGNNGGINPDINDWDNIDVPIPM